jgi:hypothetical protein
MPDPSSVHRYRKLPVEIEAVQFGLAEWGDDPWHAWRVFAEEAPQWLLDAAAERVPQDGTDDTRPRLAPVFASEDYWYFEVATLEGVMRGGPDDWLIHGVEGEFYFCKDSVFRATYEAVQ